jgi:DNA repair protein RecO (recombination protein O)
MRQRLYRTPAIVLKRMDLGEADRIVTFYSRDIGKLRAVARGVRRSTSRSAGHLEPFTVSDVLFAAGRELDVVSQVDTLVAFRPLREDLNLTTHAYYLAELVDLLTVDREENRVVYAMLIEAFRQLTQQPDARFVLITFLLRLLDELGYRPQLRACVKCDDAIQPERNQFAAHEGGAVCATCGPSVPSARPISVETLKLLRFVQQTDGTRAVTMPAHVGREAEAILRDYAEQIVERRMRSPALIARVNDASL